MFQEVFASLSKEVTGMITGFGLVIAVLNCFFGFKLRKLWVSVFGFLVGFSAGFALASLLVQDNSAVVTVAAVVLGVLLALIAYKLYQAGVFLWCGISAFTTFYQLLPFQTEWIAILVCAVLAILVGIIAVKFMRPIIILTTAVSGAFSVCQQVLPWLKVNDTLWITVAAAVLAVIGASVQFKTTSRNDR